MTRFYFSVILYSGSFGVLGNNKYFILAYHIDNFLNEKIVCGVCIFK